MTKLNTRRLCRSHDLRRRELGDRASGLSNGVLRKFTRKNKAHSSLDLTRGDRALLVVAGELRGLRGNTLKDVLHERVQNSHGLVRNTSVWVDLLEHTVNVRGVGLFTDLVASALLVGRLRRGL